MPTVGEVRKFQDGSVGKWDGQGWEDVSSAPTPPLGELRNFADGSLGEWDGQGWASLTPQEYRAKKHAMRAETGETNPNLDALDPGLMQISRGAIGGLHDQGQRIYDTIAKTTGAFDPSSEWDQPAQPMPPKTPLETVGRIGGEAAQYMVPAGPAGKLANTIVGKGAPKLATALATGAVNAPIDATIAATRGQSPVVAGTLGATLPMATFIVPKLIGALGSKLSKLHNPKAELSGAKETIAKISEQIAEGKVSQDEAGMYVQQSLGALRKWADDAQTMVDRATKNKDKYGQRMIEVPEGFQLDRAELKAGGATIRKRIDEVKSVLEHHVLAEVAKKQSPELVVDLLVGPESQTVFKHLRKLVPAEKMVGIERAVFDRATENGIEGFADYMARLTPEAKQTIWGASAGQIDEVASTMKRLAEEANRKSLGSAIYQSVSSVVGFSPKGLVLRGGAKMVEIALSPGMFTRALTNPKARALFLQMAKTGANDSLAPVYAAQFATYAGAR